MRSENLELIRLESMHELGFGIEAMRQLKVCNECGITAIADQTFCKECGNRLPNKTLYELYKERHKTCPHCEIVVPNKSDFCPQCGTKIENNISVI